MRIAIIGAAGLIGKELTRHFANGNTVVSLTRGDLDITACQAVRKVILDERPDLIINCAVLGVDACENDPALAQATNVDGPEALARVSEEIGAVIVHFSTNYVFSGKLAKGGFYSTDHAADPISVYGKTKLAGEEAVLGNSSRACIVRTSWVFGHGKSNFFSDVAANLIAGKSIRAVTDVWASTTCVSDLVNRIDEIAKHQYRGVYHIVNSGVCSYYDFALEAAKILNLPAIEIDRLIQPAQAEMMQWRASRPGYSPMRCVLSEELGFAPMRDWREALAEFIRRFD